MIEICSWLSVSQQSFTNSEPTGVFMVGAHYISVLGFWSTHLFLFRNADTQKFFETEDSQFTSRPYEIRSSPLQELRRDWHAGILQRSVPTVYHRSINRCSISDPREPHSEAEIPSWDTILSRLGLLIKKKPTVNTTCNRVRPWRHIERYTECAACS